MKNYLDDDGNFVFNGDYLEEQKAYEPPSLDARIQRGFSKIDENLKEDERKSSKNNLEAIESRFMLGKFNGKPKASDWLETFETESSRHGISEDIDKIKFLKLFMQERAVDWYLANVIKLPKDDWSLWTESFLKVFSAKGWAKVRYAYNYIQILERLSDRICFEKRANDPRGGELNDGNFENQPYIAIGLPIEIQEKIDREEIHDTDELINRLGQYDSTSRNISIPKKTETEKKKQR